MERIDKVEGAPAPIGPYALATVANGLVFVSGQGPWNPEKNAFDFDASIEVQTRLTLEAIRKVLAAAGSSMDRVVRCGVFLRDVTDFAAMNKVYAEYFGTTKPARTTVQATAPVPIKVEIDCIATL